MYTMEKDGVVSTYDVGYGDGFFRLNGTAPFATPSGSKILGRVSMDNLSAEGKADELCLFDDVRTLAKHHGTITYEILVRLAPHIKKEIVG